jgi:hypothetical protein
VYKIQAVQEKVRFIVKMAGPVVCYPNKYKIKSIDSTDSIQARNPKSLWHMDWPGEIHNVRRF